MIHEVPDTKRLLSQIHARLKPGGKFLVAEPRLHVPTSSFQRTLEVAAAVGFRQSAEQPQVRRCHAVMFVKTDPVSKDESQG
jgi:hypothetical protein